MRPRPGSTDAMRMLNGGVSLGHTATVLARHPTFHKTLVRKSLEKKKTFLFPRVVFIVWHTLV